MTTSTQQVFAAAAKYGEDGISLIDRALERAGRAHLGQFRRNGDPYVTHPLAVAAIVADLGADADLIAAALLHDLPSDTGISVDDIRHEFGDAVACIVGEFTKIDRATCLTSSGSRDARALLLKIADRLHNMETLYALAPDKQYRKAIQTVEVVAPLARELGQDPVAARLNALAGKVFERFPSGLDVDRSRRRSTTGISAAHGVLRTATGLLLPYSCRDRWLAEWTAELHDHTSPRARAAFTARLLVRLPRMALQARIHPRSGER